jgi:prephenate dehydrogenase
MRIAVIGVGLIGGSVALAARRRLGAQVTGIDPELDHSVVDDVGIVDAEIVVVATPVDTLEQEVRRALSESSGIVTDVGSVKRALVAAIDDERFIGGHPLAGAETGGVAHAREDLFDGATWYLTPRPATPGVLYERLARFVAGLGAAPTAIAPEDHDRLMAAVSHLPHVVANVLVAQAAEALGGETLPATGPSFRDATRVAGSNPPLWAQIYMANRAALGAQMDDLVRRLTEVRGLLDTGSDELREWQDAAAQQRRALLEVGLAGGDGGLREIRAAVPNKPGVVAQIALALGRAGINISDMSLAPEPDDRTGVIALWVSGADADRATELVAELGYPAAA